MTTEIKVKAWKLGDYEIQEDEKGGLTWGCYLDEPAGVNDETGESYPASVGVFIGWASIDENTSTLLMTSWKVHDSAKSDGLTTWADVVPHMAALPNWDRTKYFAKIFDFDGVFLVDCKTGEQVSDAIADDVMPKLGFRRPNMWDQVEEIVEKADDLPF